MKRNKVLQILMFAFLFVGCRKTEATTSAVIGYDGDNQAQLLVVKSKVNTILVYQNNRCIASAESQLQVSAISLSSSLTIEKNQTAPRIYEVTAAKSDAKLFKIETIKNATTASASRNIQLGCDGNLLAKKISLLCGDWTVSNLDGSVAIELCDYEAQKNKFIVKQGAQPKPTPDVISGDGTEGKGDAGATPPPAGGGGDDLIAGNGGLVDPNELIPSGGANGDLSGAIGFAISVVDNAKFKYSTAQSDTISHCIVTGGTYQLASAPVLSGNHYRINFTSTIPMSKRIRAYRAGLQEDTSLQVCGAVLSFYVYKGEVTNVSE